MAWYTALWIGLLGNWPLWHRMAGMPDFAGWRGTLFIAVFAGIVVMVLGAVFSLLAWRTAVKPLLSLMLLMTAPLAYFIGSYGVVIDSTMLTNALQTDLRETRDLLAWGLVAHLLLLAVLPLVWLWRQQVTDKAWFKRLGWNLLAVVLALVLGMGLAASRTADLASTLRNHKVLTKMVSPVNAMWAGVALAAQKHLVPKGPPERVATDAHLAPRAAGSKPPLVLLVVGETARSDNFSLNGYGKPTNPELSRLPVLSYREVSSCGTSTAASVPCMFSHLGREVFVDKPTHQETLLDVLQRAGLAVLWLDNQSGCKGVCDRVPNAQAIHPARADHPLPAGLCGADGECFDEAMLHDLDARIAALDPQRVARGVVLVLHQMGSHGPAYYKRTPEDRKPFLPECRSSALQQCPVEEVRNGYDNSIAYTDHVLADAIGWLTQQEGRFDPSLLYVSDHGESLGENNLFLHGMPYALAPREQKHVPLVLWLSPGTRAAQHLDGDCLTARRDAPMSHDGLFHTVLSLSGVQTQVYRRDWDWVGACRR
ncbi:phosphoethanolamine transferase [Roseateles sp. YR242]|uniref:phosphoethanolamine transferase n=1 Tax=Roseateles sp. YR242 TaxID=1855305 RepID=UPI0015A51FAA|nr:phosphoethanolamine--lipid A transferase [Roseateles sp. YR242]